MARVYATTEDYIEYAGSEAGTASERLLTRASMLISRALRGFSYAVDADGMPTDVKVAEAMRDATCAQVEYWDEEGDESGLGQAGEIQSAQINGVSVTRGYSGAGSAASSGYSLCDVARAHIDEANLRRKGVVVSG